MQSAFSGVGHGSGSIVNGSTYVTQKEKSHQIVRSVGRHDV